MISSTKIAARIWGIASLLISIGFAIVCLYLQEYQAIIYSFLVLPGAAIASLPALVVLILLLPFIKRSHTDFANKWWRILGLQLLICLPYGIVAGTVNHFASNTGNWEQAIEIGGAVTAVLFAAAGLATAMLQHRISKWLYDRTVWPTTNTIFSMVKQYRHQEKNRTESTTNPPLFHKQKTPDNMSNDQPFEGENADLNTENVRNSNYNRNLVKAAITAGLILAMLIPAQFISSLVQEREQRQKEVTREVSSKWAAGQTISTPYLCIPYRQLITNDTGKIITSSGMKFETAGNLNAKADMQPELRKRSIYNVLLYRANIDLTGDFIIKPGKDIKPENLLLNEARLCVGISDFKGIEEKISVVFNDTTYELEPGLPDNAIDKQGLSVAVPLTVENFTKAISFSMNLKIKGSEKLHFLPLSDNSNFEVTSSWPNPSFDGSTIPKNREVSDSGFNAKWSFNKANMPVIAQLINTDTEKENLAFGVTMVQPADQYAKTNRSVKYAILFVGLTFAMFFIIELMQKKNVHPVQYILVGLALIIFYTLLLSIGEFTGFNIAYAIAGGATVLLIGIYAHSLFASLKTSAMLSAFIGMLYGFIYVLIQLEDTALLAGSIGLFVLLAVAMYFSKRINWYGGSNTQNEHVLAA